MLKQGLQQKLLQKLSPQQIQFIKLLQVPAQALETRIQEELEENPALLDAGNTEDQTADPYGLDDLPATTTSAEVADTQRAELNEDAGKAEEISLEEYMRETDDYDYKTWLPEDGGERYEAPIVQKSSLYDLLESQVGMLNLSDKERTIALHIIGNIDEDGYLRRPIMNITDDLAFRFNLQATDEQVEDVLGRVQTLDPAGIGARDLQECLLLQLDRKRPNVAINLAREILYDYFEEFTKKHFDKIKDRLGVDDDIFKQAYNQIIKLNPKPGEGQTEVKHQYIVPDFILTVNGQEIDVKLNRKNAPELRVNNRYLNMLKELETKGKGERLDKETAAFIKTKIENAKWFIDAMKQRQITLMKTMMTIVEKQREFFLGEGDETALRPMILKDIADEIEMDISTVSRVVNSKYVQTDFGIFNLKHFFSEGIATENGEEVSNKEIKRILQECIGSEDKQNPVSDDRLMQILNEKGYPIARRTVAKYREQLNIPVARLRREL